MSSRFGTRTYSRKPACQSSIQFEKVFNEKANRPTAAKSAGILHKWGKTSFTSIRNSQVNGQKDEPEVVKRPKLAPPVIDHDDDPFSFDLDTEVPHNPSTMTLPVAVPVAEPKLSPSVPRPNKFFKSGNRGSLQTYSKRLATSKTQQRTEEVLSAAPMTVVEQLDTVSVDVVLGNCLSSVVCSNSVVAYPSPDDQHKSLTAFDELFRTTSKSPHMHVNDNVHPLSPVSSPVADETDSQTMLFSPRAHMALGSNSINHNSSSSDEQGDSNDVADSPVEPTVNRRVVRTYSSLRSRGGGSAAGLTQSTSVATTTTTSKPTNNPTPIVLRFSGCNTLSNVTVSSSTSVPPTINTASLFTPSPTTTGLEGDDSSSQSQGLWSQDPEQSSESSSVQTALSFPVGSPQRNFTSDQSKLAWDVITGAVAVNTEPQGNLPSAPSSAVTSQSTERTQPPSSSSPSPIVISSESELPAAAPTDSPLPPEPPVEAEEATTSCAVPRPTRAASLRSRRIFNSPKKQVDKKSLYKHRPWQADEDEAKELESDKLNQKSLSEEFYDETEDEIAPLVRVTTWPTRIGDEAITSLKCSKKAKELYKVVRNVKQAHQCHEIGETQEFNDDIEYLLDGLQDTIPTSTRCLSVLSLAGKCMVPGFRMHLRAHGTISKIFSALHDAPSEPNMALCTATVMFILSQDRLNMDLERSSLELMLALLDTESTAAAAVAAAAKSSTPELGRNLAKVRDLCEEVQKKGHARHLSLDNITSGHLAMETLLSLTSRRAGEWFKEELRELGGLEHIVATVSQCVTFLGQESIDELRKPHFDKISKVDRCLRVLENVTFMNTENQSYLIEYKDALLVVSIVKVLRLTTSFLPNHSYTDKADRDCPGAILFGTVLTVLRVLLNLTNENSYGSMRIGEQDGLVEVALRCILHMPKFVPVEQVFDLLILSLGLLINLAEHCTVNRRKLLAADVPPLHPPTDWLEEQEEVSAITALVNLFVEREETARQEEAKTDSLLDGSLGEGDKGDNADGAPNSQPSQDDIEDTLTKALQKAGKHMEDSMVAAYVALLLGCIIQDGEEAAQLVRDQLPENNFLIMVQILQKFLNFIHLTSTVGNTGMKSIQRVIEVLESC